ncbi:AsnC family transcriptional regulator [Ammoniphilus oxalaticus]|uniref:AsnC family transcriptional regulator n=1 Tax=Ammoniphilus oxalaticus TaxID=66863 RepID=A0A419SGQ5_9BACL|nr:Lrp/AsnC family transcriptional regulator [Ammoniphilus oxalaticus]RKD22959.1 AsnC family transcriptional regulator [Ammoniphilus oxalaticus]
MKLKDIDAIDAQILRLLSKNGRMSNAEIGRVVDLSRAAVRERVNSLVENEIIERFTIVVDPRKAGTQLSVYFDIEVEWMKLESVVEALVAYDEITNVYQMSGSLHLHSHAMLDDTEHVEEFILKLYAIDGIKDITSEMLLRRFKEERSILI